MIESEKARGHHLLIAVIFSLDDARAATSAAYIRSLQKSRQTGYFDVSASNERTAGMIRGLDIMSTAERYLETAWRSPPQVQETLLNDLKRSRSVQDGHDAIGIWRRHNPHKGKYS